MAFSYYSCIHAQWFYENAKKHNDYNTLANEFNAIFGLNKSSNAIMQYITKRLKISLCTEKKSQRYTTEETDWLKENYSQCKSYNELTEKYNSYFGKNRTVDHLRDKCTKQLNLKGMPNNFTFKKGHKINIHLPIGTIRTLNYGNKYIKVLDTYQSFNQGYTCYKEPWWMPIQKKLWIDNYGELPKDVMIMFLDKNHDNLKIENLYPVNKSIHAIMCKNRWYSTDPNATLTAIKWCELFYAIKK